MRRWYLIQTKPNSHRIAEKNLARQGCTVFLPLAEQTRREGNRFRTKFQPLFPGYLFAGLSEGAPSWRSINATQGVSRGVSLDGQYRPVPETLILGLKARCDADGVFRAQNALSAGDQVQIQKGPFASFLAEVESLAPDRRVWVLIDLLGQKSRISQHEDDLQRAI